MLRCGTLIMLLFNAARVGYCIKRSSTRHIQSIKSSIGGVGTEFYYTLAAQNVCGLSCCVVQTPATADFNFHSFVPTTSEQSEQSLSGISCEKQGLQCSLLRDEVMQEEVEFGWKKERGKLARLNVFIGGRIALRRAIASEVEKQGLIVGEDVSVGPILSNDLGAPSLPDIISGSITHKDGVAAAAALLHAPIDTTTASKSQRTHAGIDLERCKNRSSLQLQRRLLSEKEQESLLSNYDEKFNKEVSTDEGLTILGPVNSEEDVMLRFSFKEAVFKAINPILRRHVEFKEVDVFPVRDGSATLHFNLRTGEMFRYSAEWRRFQRDYWLTCVTVTPPME